MKSYILSHDENLSFYKQNVSDFASIMERNNKHLIEQFKNIDESYNEQSPQKMKSLLMVVSQYKDIKRSLHNPKMLQIFQQKQALLTEYVSDEMSRSVEQIDSIRG